MLVRVVPDMLVDAIYHCGTIVEVRQEIFQTSRFKSKYPWRDQYKDKIRSLPSILTQSDSTRLYFEAITALVENGAVNRKTEREFDLSFIDRRILACVLANGFRLCTGDRDLREFAGQEFAKEFKGNISPLGLINRWMRRGLIEWNERSHELLADWGRNNEHPQPATQKAQFKKLTGLKYPAN
jgi:hypothetical protein